MANIGVIGWGVVGKALGDGFAINRENHIFWYDKKKKSPYKFSEVIEKSEFIFVCVPTPMRANFSGIDLSIMDEVVGSVAKLASGTNKIVVIKSTVVPGTTKAYAKKYRKVNFAMNPEFLTEINAPWDFMNPDRLVIGALSEDVVNRVAILYRSLYGHDVKIFLTDPTSAELTKYMANTYLATKIIFANEMKSLADKLEVDYNEVLEMVSYDPRIGKHFLRVTPFKGFGGKCFPKDTVALLGLAKSLSVDLSVIKAAWKKNLKIRKVRDWEKIEGAIGKKH